MENNLISPFILHEDGLEIYDIPKIHCNEEGTTRDDHTIQNAESGLFVPLSLDGILSVFHKWIPTEEDLDDSVVILITREGVTWNPYEETYAVNEASLTDVQGNLLPSEYIHCELIIEDDYGIIGAVLVMDNHVDRFNTTRIVSAVRLLDGKPSPSDSHGALPPVVVSDMSELVSEALTLSSIDWNPVYDPMPIKQDEIFDVLLSVNNSLDPLSFSNSLVNDATVSRFKISIRATSALQPEVPDDL